MIAQLLIVLVMLALGGCGSSPPTKYYMLSKVAPAGHAEAKPPYPLQVNAVHIPAVLDRNQMVRQTGANTLSISGDDWWGAPFGEMARNVLERDLAARLPQGSVIPALAPAPPSAAHLVVNIVTFGEDPDRRVRLVARWTVLHGQSASVIAQDDVDLSETALDSGAAAQAHAMSRLLGELADHIAAGFLAAPAPHQSLNPKTSPTALAAPLKSTKLMAAD
jgi:uncharacterized protein